MSVAKENNEKALREQKRWKESNLNVKKTTQGSQAGAALE